MNLSKSLLGGVIGGIIVSLANFVMHGMIMGPVYMKYPLFRQEQANPLWFFLIAIVIACFAAILFAKTRSSWPPGIGGGVRYGFFLGMVIFFINFYLPLVLEGMPYHLGWCWGGIDLIGFVILGAVLGIVNKGDR